MTPNYTGRDRNVFVRTRAPGESLIRDALAEGLASVQGAKPDLAAADDLCMSVGTLRNIRNRTNTASLKIVSDAAHCTDGKFIAPWLATLGYRAVPLSATCTTDTGVQTDLARLGLKIAMALDPSSPGGSETTSDEARDMIADLDRFQAHMDRIRRLAVSA